MNIVEVISELDRQIAALQQARALLHEEPVKRGPGPPKKLSSLGASQKDKNELGRQMPPKRAIAPPAKKLLRHPNRRKISTS